ncbi:MAG: LysR family transcriptional regulator [Acidimicrobiales bacterium]
MDLRQLRALTGVADHGTFSAAADALHTVQSNVSTHIARLERELHTTLVDRSTGRLTEAGDAVVSRARRIDGELEAMVADIAALRHEVIGTARLGMIGTTARWLVPQLLHLGAQRHPGLRLEVTEGTSTALEVPLLAGRLDLVVGTLPVPDDDLLFAPLFAEDLVLVVGKGDALSRHEEIGLEALAGVPMLLPLPGTAFRSEIDSAAAAAGVQLSVRAEVDGTRLLASLTFDGYGPAVLPATAVPGYLRDDWRLVRVRDLPRRSVGIARRRRGLPSAPAKAVHQLVVDLTSFEAGLPPGLHTLLPPRSSPAQD